MTSHPAIRLAYHPEGDRTLSKLTSPSVRLAVAGASEGRNRALFPREGPSPRSTDSIPALLVSYYYLDSFIKERSRFVFRDWVMDSGAFSAANSGVTIELAAYLACCKRLLAEDPALTEVFSLDVIGDWRASEKNTRTLWGNGVPAIPTFHRGEPWSVLVGLAKDYPKIALGGVVGLKKRAKSDWVGQCFARVWPKPIHGLGMSSEDMVLSFPFHSVDATTWEIAPCKFGRWQSFGNLSVRGGKQDLRAEVEWHLKLERRARSRWRKQMAMLPPPYGTGDGRGT